jgi:hypothetical protein
MIHLGGKLQGCRNVGRKKVKNQAENLRVGILNRGAITQNP